ncbi:MAG: exodeoxyribonuclease VII large subunit [Planctomycetota bacterium]
MASLYGKQNESDAPWSVAALAGHIKDALTAGLPRRVRVVGEVSNLSDRNHWFFSLKDGGGSGSASGGASGGASIRSVMFASAARRVRFPVRDGMQVVASGRVDFYDAQGSVQLYVESIEPVGEGARELALRAMIEELRELGYFDPAHKKPLPGVPQKIAVVTSRSAAALQDVIDTAGRRWAGCELVLVDVRVQGDGAAPGISAALRYLSEHGRELGIDAVLLTRGGGSIEDLWAFNERAVADAVYACRLPVVAAIGHETDTTVAELVADVRCATPTQAAMTLVPDRATLEQQVEQLSRRLTLALQRRAEHFRGRVEAAARHALFRRPGDLVTGAEDRLDRVAARLHGASAMRAMSERRRVEALGRTLEAVSPTNVLRRGYSYTLGPSGKLLTRAEDAEPGSKLTTVLADGKVRSTVDGGPNTSDTGTDGGSAPRRPRRLKPKTKPGSDEPMLFA